MTDDKQGHYPHSRYRGVAWHSTAHKWRAYFRGQHLGLFDQEMTAAIVAYRARRDQGHRTWEDPEVVQQSALAGSVESTRHWHWNRSDAVDGPAQ